MNAERLKLVTSFDELRAGSLTIVKNCAECGSASCRAILAELVDGEWSCLPNCSPDPDDEATISTDCVAIGVVYLVDTSLEAADASTATTRKPASVRT